MVYDEFQWKSMKTKCCLLAPLTHRPAGIWSPVGGWVSGAGGLRHSPTGQQGSKSLLAGGWVAREACAAHPPASREPTPVRGVALVLGGQNPITLEYQIYPPPIDTLVTGMIIPTDEENQLWVDRQLNVNVQFEQFE